MGCVSHFAKSVTAIEMDTNYCNKLRQRGFGVACQKVEEITAQQWPVADVYYWWPSDAAGQNELWLRLISRALRANNGARATVFIGFDAHWKPDMDVLPTLVQKYNGTVSRVFFDEGGAVSGSAVESPIFRRATHKLEASLKRPFFDRPGHWGVFHVARFEVGPAMWRHMRSIHFSHPELALWAKRSFKAKPTL